MALKYIDVVVEEHDALPEGCELRFHAVGEAQVVERVLYEPLDGAAGEFSVVAAGANGGVGRPAWRRSTTRGRGPHS